MEEEEYDTLDSKELIEQEYFHQNKQDFDLDNRLCHEKQGINENMRSSLSSPYQTEQYKLEKENQREGSAEFEMSEGLPENEEKQFEQKQMNEEEIIVAANERNIQSPNHTITSQIMKNDILIETNIKNMLITSSTSQFSHTPGQSLETRRFSRNSLTGEEHEHLVKQLKGEVSFTRKRQVKRAEIDKLKINVTSLQSDKVTSRRNAKVTSDSRVEINHQEESIFQASEFSQLAPNTCDDAIKVDLTANKKLEKARKKRGRGRRKGKSENEECESNLCRIQSVVEFKMKKTLLNNENVFLLLGDVLIELNFLQRDVEESVWEKECEIRKYKAIESVTYSEKTRCLWLRQASNKNFLIDFEFLARKLYDYPDQNVHNLAEIMNSYQDIAKLVHMRVKEASITAGFTPQLLAERRTYFDRKLDEFLAGVDSNEMYVCQKFHTNYSTASYECCEVGYSRSFLALLGTDQSTFTPAVMRNGKPQLYDAASRLKMMLSRMMSIVQGKFRGIQYDFEITTFDNIKVFAKFNIVPVCVNYPEELQLPLTGYKEIDCMILAIVEVSPTMIQQVLEIRKYDKFHQHLKLMAQTRGYNEQSIEFLEKYYVLSKSKHTTSRQNLAKRRQIGAYNQAILSSIIPLQQESSNESTKSCEQLIDKQHDSAVNQQNNEMQEEENIKKALEFEEGDSIFQKKRKASNQQLNKQKYEFLSQTTIQHNPQLDQDNQGVTMNLNLTSNGGDIWDSTQFCKQKNIADFKVDSIIFELNLQDKNQP